MAGATEVQPCKRRPPKSPYFTHLKLLIAFKLKVAVEERLTPFTVASPVSREAKYETKHMQVLV